MNLTIALYTTAQLTEGRSARDQPKQPPAKKKTLLQQPFDMQPLLESPGRDGTHHVSLIALGGSKAVHKFLVLHYMASAEECDFFPGHLPTSVHMGALGGRSPYTCIISAMWSPLTDLPILLTAAFAHSIFCGTCLMSKWRSVASS